jgi:hypothetical protein
MADAFESRRKELEEAFFAQHNQKLLDHLKELKKQSLTKASLGAMSGITDEGVLDKLVALKLNTETLAAFILYPLVEVAWADGVADNKEKKAVLDGCHKLGIAAGTEAHKLVESWLEQRPPATLHTAWEGYVKALVGTMSTHDKDALKRSILGKARDVAEASGGILGLPPKVSKEEAAVLKKLESAFG